jgi:hypothetical protein
LIEPEIAFRSLGTMASQAMLFQKRYDVGGLTGNGRLTLAPEATLRTTDQQNDSARKPWTK